MADPPNKDRSRGEKPSGTDASVAGPIQGKRRRDQPAAKRERPISQRADEPSAKDDTASIATPPESAADDGATVLVPPPAPADRAAQRPDDGATVLVPPPSPTGRATEQPDDGATVLVPPPAPTDRATEQPDDGATVLVPPPAPTDRAAQQPDDGATVLVPPPAPTDRAAQQPDDGATVLVPPPSPTGQPVQPADDGATVLVPPPAPRNEPAPAGNDATLERGPPPRPGRDTPPPDDRTVQVAPPRAAATPAARADDQTIAVPPPSPPAAERPSRPAPPTTTPTPQAAPARQLCLLGEEGTRVAEFSLKSPEVQIGRSSRCDIVLTSPSVSRRHASIVDRAGKWRIVPVAAGPRIRVNGENLDDERVLAQGDLIELGGERLVFEAEGVMGTAAATVAAIGRPPAPKRRVGWIAGVVGLAAVVLVAVYVVRSRDRGLVETATAPTTGVTADETIEVAAEPGPATKRVPSAAQEAEIKRLLYAADVAFLEYRYLSSPKEEGAFYNYKKVLEIDPDNPRAKAQLEQMMSDYLTWAEHAQREGRSTEATAFADKAAFVLAELPQLAGTAAVEERLEQLRR